MKQVITLSVLLGVTLIGAYLSWTADETDTDRAEQIQVYRADIDDVQEIAWKDATTDIAVERKTDDAGAYLWITVSETTEVIVAPEPGTADTGGELGPDASGEEPPPEPEPTVETKTQTVSFKGNETADEMWANFAPLYALRELSLATSDSAAFGFGDESATLEITRKGEPITLVIGGETYGSKDRYAKHGERILLIDDKTLRPLQFAKTRLVARTLHPLEENGIDAFEVVAGEQRVQFVHKNKEDRAAEFWARADTPAEADETVKTWIGKVLRMRVQGYSTDEEAGELETAFTYTVKGGGDTWTVEVLTSASDDAHTYYGRSSWSRSLVELTESLASEAVADLDSVLPEG